MHKLASAHRLLVAAILGFSSGLPLALTGQALQAWLSVEGIDLATIGFLSLVGVPYTFKFLWAPLMDRFELPWLGRRRGWLLLTQLALAGCLWALSLTSPSAAMPRFALLALLVAFVSASHDVVVDAYRTDLLEARERGLGASLATAGYRFAMVLSGGIALIWTDAAAGGGWTWPQVYRLMAGLMAGAALLTLVLLPRLRHEERPHTDARHDLIGFVAVLAAVVVGVLLTQHVLRPGAEALLAPMLRSSVMPPALQARWVDLAALLCGIALTLPLAAWAARAARFETLLSGLGQLLGQRGAWAMLALIVLYKLGDAFAGALLTPFLLQGVGFSSAEVGVVNKVFGLWLTIVGALAGGVLMLKLGMWRALFLFGLLQAASNLGFWWLADQGRGSMPAFVLPPFDWGFVALTQPTPVDGGLLMVVAFENLSGGMGTAAFFAFLMSLCDRRFTATQFALLSAFASIGRVWVGPLAGVLAASIGWPTFFVLSTVCALPALLMLWWLRADVQALEVDPTQQRGVG